MFAAAKRSLSQAQFKFSVKRARKSHRQRAESRRSKKPIDLVKQQFCLLILDTVNKIDYIAYVKSTEFKRWLAGQGATFESAKGSHMKVILNGKTSYLPMHSKELGTGLVNTIKKQLGLK
jgi:mRNA interferase HicA